MIFLNRHTHTTYTPITDAYLSTCTHAPHTNTCAHTLKHMYTHAHSHDHTCGYNCPHTSWHISSSLGRNPRPPTRTHHTTITTLIPTNGLATRKTWGLIWETENLELLEVRSPKLYFSCLFFLMCCKNNIAKCSLPIMTMLSTALFFKGTETKVGHIVFC